MQSRVSSASPHAYSLKSQYGKVSNVVSLDEIEQLLDELDDILHIFTIQLLDKCFMVKDLCEHAHEDVNRLVAGLKKDAESQSSQPQ